MEHNFKVGDVIHGFAAGAYGRDSFSCRVVEAVGADWVLTRNTKGEVETVSGALSIPTRAEAADRSHCEDDCSLVES